MGTKMSLINVSDEFSNKSPHLSLMAQPSLQWLFISCGGQSEWKY